MTNEELETLIDDICDELGFPHSGTPEDALRRLHELLRTVDTAAACHWHVLHMDKIGETDSELAFTLSCLDALGLLDYGVSVNCPWLSAKGKATLGRLEGLFG